MKLVVSFLFAALVTIVLARENRAQQEEIVAVDVPCGGVGHVQDGQRRADHAHRRCERFEVNSRSAEGRGAALIRRHRRFTAAATV